MDDDRRGQSLGTWGAAFATAGVAIAFVTLIVIPALIFIALCYLGRGMPASPGD